MAGIRYKNYRHITGIALIFVFLSAVVLFSTPVFLKSVGLPQINGRMLIYNRIFLWVGLLGLWFYAKYFESEKWILTKEVEYPGKFYLPAIVLLLAGISVGSTAIGILFRFLFQETGSIRLSEFVLLMRGNLLLLFFVAATAAITEEIIFRGYIQSRLESIFKGHWPAIITTAALFAVLHASYGTLSQVAIPFYIGLVFSWFYWKFRSIRILIIVHFLFDLISLLVLINRL